jgi:hypothetical protein
LNDWIIGEKGERRMLAVSAVGGALVLVALGGLALISLRNGRRAPESDGSESGESHTSPN